MKKSYNGLLPPLIKALLSGLLLSAVIVPHASAHLMVAQNGTLNIVGNGVFMVLSLPISAFDNVDDDGDKKLSRAEFTKHRPALIAAVNEKVRLFEKDDPRPLQGMMLSPVAPHTNPFAPANQLVIMGRFQLTDINNKLNFHLELFGKAPEEQEQKISFSHSAKSLKNKTVMTPKLTHVELFSSKPAPKLAETPEIKIIETDEVSTDKKTASNDN